MIHYKAFLLEFLPTTFHITFCNIVLAAVMVDGIFEGFQLSWTIVASTIEMLVNYGQYGSWVNFALCRIGRFVIVRLNSRAMVYTNPE